MTISIAYVWRYAHKIKKDPTKSVLYGIETEMLEVGSREELINKKFTLIHKISCLLFVFTIVMLYR